MLTNSGPLLVTLSREADVLKRSLKACEKAVQATMAMSRMSDPVKAVVADLADKQEHGTSLEMRAEFAQKFKKTMDGQHLDETMIENLTDDVRNAVNDITRAGVVLKHELKVDRSRLCG